MHTTQVQDRWHKAVTPNPKKRPAAVLRYKAQCGRFIALGATHADALANLFAKVISQNQNA
jgi:hypothetical protein